MQRAAHQLLETPAVFEDPLALRIFGAQGVAWLGRNLDYYRTGGCARDARVPRHAQPLCRRRARARGRARRAPVRGARRRPGHLRLPQSAPRTARVRSRPSRRRRPGSAAGWREQGIDVPRSLAFAPVDFETQTLADGPEGRALSRRPAGVLFLARRHDLPQQGGGRRHAALHRGAARPAARWCSTSRRRRSAIGEQERAGRERSALRVAKAGEPWINFYSPGPLAAELRASGYSAARALGSEEMNERYFRNRPDGFRLYGSGQMMTAQV